MIFLIVILNIVLQKYTLLKYNYCLIYYIVLSFPIFSNTFSNMYALEIYGAIYFSMKINNYFI